MGCFQKKFIFGPVDSRRLGRSLGVSIVPFKTCSMDCIYCECGATTVLSSERKEFFPVSAITGELDQVLAARKKLHGDHAVDCITFSGVGEPTLHASIGKIISYIHEKYPALKCCLLTNASLLTDPEVRHQISAADIVIPSLDGSNEEEFQKINRPAAGITMEKTLRGILDFRKETAGRVQMFLEIFLVPGINDSEGSAERFLNLVKQIMPDKVQLNSLDRPGIEKWLRPVPESVLKMFAGKIGQAVPVEIPVRRDPDAPAHFTEIEYALLESLQKKERSLAELIREMEKEGLSGEETERHLENLLKAETVSSREDGNYFPTSFGKKVWKGKK